MILSKQTNDIKEYILDQLEDNIGLDEFGGDLHHELLNTQLYLQGSQDSIKWLGGDSWEAIEKVREYEEFNFGEVTTNTSNPVKVANMLAYIIGEEILYNCKHVYLNTDRRMTENTLEIIKSEVRNYGN